MGGGAEEVVGGEALGAAACGGDGEALGVAAGEAEGDWAREEVASNMKKKKKDVLAIVREKGWKVMRKKKKNMKRVNGEGVVYI